MKYLICVLLFVSQIAGDSNSEAKEKTPEPKAQVVLAQDVKWQPLNPARGKKGPQAGTLWGDQTGSGASGFLVKFIDGFSSPPHIHNITYRGIVIAGALHNDDPEATPLWMKAGSYWTQPAGEAHITSARGPSIAYVEIATGPYLVMPTEKAFDNGERPVNVDASNVMWLDGSNTSWIRKSPKVAPEKGPKLAFLWGKPQKGHVNGTMIKLPAGFKGKIAASGSVSRYVVVQGRLTHHANGGEKAQILEAGSYFGSPGKSEHRISANEESILYVSTNGPYEAIAASTGPSGE
ncbi:MAG: DUF4437 domain-containing protein [Lacipirellulaceae bacterium]